MADSKSARETDLEISHVEDTDHEASSSRVQAQAKSGEKAAEFLAAVDEDTSFTQEEENPVLRKVDFRILPILLGAYFFQQLDKSSLSYVSIFGITKDAHLVGKQYSWLGSILYVAQLVMQPLAAVVLVKAPTGKVIAFAVFLWGATLAIMSVCKNFHSLLGMRFLLGTFESLIAPSCVAVTQMWWRRSEQTFRTTMWNAMNGVTFIIGSLFTYGLGHIKSHHLFSYQIVFLFCGLLTVSFSAIVLIWMPDSPMDAKFLDQREKVIAVERLRANQMGIISRKWRWDHLFETLYDLKTWLWFVLVLAISIPSGGIGTFGNLILKDFGFDKFHAILFNIPFGVVQIIATLGAGWLATKIKMKGVVIALAALPAVVGVVIMLTVPRHNKGVLLFGYYLVSFMAAITPIIYAWEAQNTAGDTKRKCTSAVVFIGMCAGNIIGPQLYSVDQAPLYRPGLTSSLILFIIEAVIALLISLYLVFLNRSHAKKRVAVGKSAAVIDESMITHKQIAAIHDLGPDSINHEAVDTQAQKTADKGFEDVTDLKNEDFIFVY